MLFLQFQLSEFDWGSDISYFRRPGPEIHIFFREIGLEVPFWTIHCRTANPRRPALQSQCMQGLTQVGLAATDPSWFLYVFYIYFFPLIFNLFMLVKLYHWTSIHSIVSLDATVNAKHPKPKDCNLIFHFFLYFTLKSPTNSAKILYATRTFDFKIWQQKMPLFQWSWLCVCVCVRLGPFAPLHCMGVNCDSMGQGFLVAAWLKFLEFLPPSPPLPPPPPHQALENPDVLGRSWAVPQGE